MNTDNKNTNNQNNANNTNRDKNDTSKSDVSTSQDPSKSAQSNISQGRTDSQNGQNIGTGKLDEKSQQHAKVDPSTDAARKDAK